MLCTPMGVDTYDVIKDGVRFHVFIVGLAATAIALRVFYLLRVHPLSDIPGPELASLTDLWKTHAVLRGRFATALHEQHVKHGDVVRIGPNEVSIVSPEDVKFIYGHKSEFLKGPFYNAWGMLGKGHFSNRDEVTHNINRRAVAAAYTLNHLTSLEQYCNACADLLMRHLDEASKHDAFVDLAQLIKWYTYDSVSGIGFGSLFGLLENGGDFTGFLTVMARTTQIITSFATLTNFGWILATQPVTWLASKMIGGKGPALFISYGLRLVKARQELRDTDRIAYEASKDMLYRFMESTNSATSRPLDTRLLLSNALSIIVAGADTTSTSIIASLRYVYAHPPTLERLRREIDDAVAAGRVTFPITYSQATRLEFAWACTREAMRLHPAVGMTLQRVVPSGGRVIGGRFYGGGTLVGMSPREIHYDTRAYGNNAGEWRPERWLTEERNQLENFSLVFGQGTRACLGKNISLMQMSKLLPTIIYYYDVKIQDPTQPWTAHESWFNIQTDFRCLISKRERPT